MQEMQVLPRGQEDPLEKEMQPLQNSCLGNPMDRGTWQVTVCGVERSWTQSSDWIITTSLLANFNGKNTREPCKQFYDNIYIYYIYTLCSYWGQLRILIFHITFTVLKFLFRSTLCRTLLRVDSWYFRALYSWRGLTAFPLSSSNQESLCFFFSLHQKYMKNINL